MQSSDLVFISYAREDRHWAERLYMDLRKQEINAWIDVRCLAAGANWKMEIKKAIRASRFFILLISNASVNKRGFVQKEMKEAIDVLREIPRGQVFLMPVRLDSTEPIDDELHELNWVDLADDYHGGLARILSSLAGVQPAPLIISGSKSAPTLPAEFIDKGKKITLEMPLMIGERAPVSYAPFRTRKEFLQQFFDRLPTDSIFADRRLSYYISLDTRHSQVSIGDDLKASFPEYITLVLQNAYRDLQARQEGVSVVLAFGGVERSISWPYGSVVRIHVPEIGVTMTFDSPEDRTET
jgi:hypothetical protein